MGSDCSTCSNVCEANAVLTDQGSIDEYWKQLHKLDNEGMLPNLNQELYYNVYTIKAGGACGHMSVVLSSNNIHFVTVELGLQKKGGQWYVFPTTRKLGQGNHHKLVRHGQVMKTGYQLINSALEVMKKFGRYNRVCRNCHNYCDMFIKANGL